MATTFRLQVFVRVIHRNFESGINLHLGTYLNTCPWNPGTYRHKIVRLSSAQFGLVMLKFLCALLGVYILNQQIGDFSVIRSKTDIFGNSNTNSKCSDCLKKTPAKNENFN